MALGAPSISTPNRLELVALQQTIANIRERFGATDAVVRSLQQTTAAASQQATADLSSLQRAINALGGRVKALEDAGTGGSAGSGDTFAALATEAMSQGAPVWLSGDGQVSLIDPDQALQAAGCVGVTTADVAAGLTVEVRRRGIVTVPGATFTPGRPLYAERDGLTHEPLGNALPVGVAVTATTASVAPGTLALTVPGIDLAGEPYLPVAYELAGPAITLANRFAGSGAGFVVKAGPDDILFRQLAPGTGIAISDGDGILGDPLIEVSNIPQSAVVDLEADLLALQDLIVLIDGDLDAHVAATIVHGTTSAVVGVDDTQTLTGKTIDGASNTLTVRLASDVTGNLPVTNLDSGTGATATTFWRGDGTWATPAGGGGSVAWGAITGTLSDQTDLQAALDDKLDDSQASLYGLTLLAALDPADAQSLLDLVPGTDVQAFSANLAAIAGLTTAADQLTYWTGAGTAAQTSLSAFGRTLIDDADASAARTTLGLVIGTNVQAQDAELQALAGLTSAADRVPYFTGSGTAALAVFTAYARTLVDDVDAAAARTTLGLGTMATESASLYALLSGATFTGATQHNVGLTAGAGAASNSLILAGSTNMPATGYTAPAIFSSSTTGSPGSLAGHLIYQGRSDAARGHYFLTGTTPTIRFSIDAAGAAAFTGALDVAGSLTAPGGVVGNLTGNVTGQADTASALGSNAVTDLNIPFPFFNLSTPAASGATNGPGAFNVAALTLRYSATAGAQLAIAASPAGANQRAWFRGASGSAWAASWTELARIGYDATFGVVTGTSFQGPASALGSNSVTDLDIPFPFDTASNPAASSATNSPGLNAAVLTMRYSTTAGAQIAVSAATGGGSQRMWWRGASSSLWGSWNELQAKATAASFTSTRTTASATTGGDVATVYSLIDRQRFQTVDSSRTSNNRQHEFNWNAGTLQGRFVNDAYTSAAVWLNVTGGQASGVVATDIYAGSGTFITRTDAAGFYVNGPSSNPNPGHYLNLNGSMYSGNTAGAAGFVFRSYNRSGVNIGSITQAGTTGVAFNTTSDARRKKDVADAGDALSMLASIKVRQFRWISTNGLETFGLIAQELFEVWPRAVRVGGADADRDPWGVDHSSLVPVLIKALQQAVAKIETAESEQSKLVARITRIEKLPMIANLLGKLA